MTKSLLNLIRASATASEFGTSVPFSSVVLSVTYEKSYLACHLHTMACPCTWDPEEDAGHT